LPPFCSFFAGIVARLLQQADHVLVNTP